MVLCVVRESTSTPAVSHPLVDLVWGEILHNYFRMPKWQIYQNTCHVMNVAPCIFHPLILSPVTCWWLYACPRDGGHPDCCSLWKETGLDLNAQPLLRLLQLCRVTQTYHHLRSPPVPLCISCPQFPQPSSLLYLTAIRVSVSRACTFPWLAAGPCWVEEDAAGPCPWVALYPLGCC